MPGRPSKAAVIQVMVYGRDFAQGRRGDHSVVSAGGFPSVDSGLETPMRARLLVVVVVVLEYLERQRFLGVYWVGGGGNAKRVDVSDWSQSGEVR